MNLSVETELGADDIEVWNQIWDNLYETHYRSFYEELCAEHSLKVWQRFDAIFKILQITTASGSAIAGWSLWQKEGFRSIWMVLAGLTVLLSFVHERLNIGDKIKEDSLTYSKFKNIRVQCERLNSHMKIKAYERLSDYKRDYMELRSEYDNASVGKRPDFLLRKKTEEKIQAHLNKIIGTI